MNEGIDIEQAITVGIAQAIGIIVGIVGGVTAMTIALIVHFDNDNERCIGDVKAFQKSIKSIGKRRTQPWRSIAKSSRRNCKTTSATSERSHRRLTEYTAHWAC